MSSCKRIISLIMVMIMAIALSSCAGPASNEATKTTDAITPTNDASTSSTEKSDVQESDNWDVSNIPSGRYVIAAGSSGGPQNLLAGAFAEKIMANVPQVTVNVEPGGAFSNFQLVNKGDTDIGFSVTCTSYEGWNGIETFKDIGAMKDSRSIAISYPMYFHFVALADSGIKSVYDIKGRRYTPSYPGQTAHIMASLALELHGFSFEDCKLFPQSFAESATMMKDKQIDAMSWNLSLPQAPLTELSRNQDIVLVPWGEGMVDKFVEKYPQYSSGYVEPKFYKFLEEPYYTVKIVADILVNKDLDDVLIYHMTKAYYDNLEEYLSVAPANVYVNIENTLNDLVIPLHPGAAKYFEEKGFSIPENIKPIDK